MRRIHHADFQTYSGQVSGGRRGAQLGLGVPFSAGHATAKSPAAASLPRAPALPGAPNLLVWYAEMLVENMLQCDLVLCTVCLSHRLPELAANSRFRGSQRRLQCCNLYSIRHHGLERAAIQCPADTRLGKQFQAMRLRGRLLVLREGMLPIASLDCQVAGRQA